ncbi:phosphoadenosine phosphosulfate reductase domain-containing protein [Sphingomonas oryzagri]|uniref:Phosphoadenosine phosphosulfate reductase family protein n=1 Tax=Sphingomonas oryzagri TaxID=3042314 RepID=A0ABT6N619_9SPHN|nr:phosphoadenosine phosphosulfate reductase family protein [Sphingomonas oryzagri]MDH7640551.1 phosphoadenosine phosphosulfate reductase family protein [Sphingomonas oryzagri]
MNVIDTLYALDAKRPQSNLFNGDHREAVGECVQRTVANMLTVATRYDHWIIAYSGGKDSSTVVTVIVTLLQLGAIPRPKTLIVMYADTRMELPPLQAAARLMMQRLREMGIEVIEVVAPMDDRFFVYMFGRGVPPPSNTFRWCTPQIKVEPMTAAIRDRIAGLDGRVLTLTGVRRGESKARDDRINLSCSRNGAECGQGWLQTDLPGDLTDTFAPIDHWTLCNVWDWLSVFALWPEFGSWPTAIIAEGYGEIEDMRTGCVECNLIEHDGALGAVLRMGGWEHLVPLLGLKILYRELKKPRHRKRKSGGQTRKDGTLQTNQQRMGPLTFEARLMGLDTVLRIQRQVNDMAAERDRPGIVLIDETEEARIRELITLKTWPRDWSESDPDATVWLDRFNPDGSVEPILYRDLVGQ